MKAMIDDVLATVTDEQYFRELFNAQKVKSPSELFNDWLYENYSIGNGEMLINLMENTAIQTNFLLDHDLPLDTEL